MLPLIKIEWRRGATRKIMIFLELKRAETRHKGLKHKLEMDNDGFAIRLSISKSIYRIICFI